jgi:hypothetical protein
MKYQPGSVLIQTAKGIHHTYTLMGSIRTSTAAATQPKSSYGHR